MEYEEVRLLLRSGNSQNILRALTQLRSREVKSQSGLQSLLEENVVAVLVPLLERSNHKIIDITLSILGNLLQSEVAQEQVRQAGGLGKLVNIVENIQDRNILCRGWRCLANACQNKENQLIMRCSHNLSSSLAKLIASTSPADQMMVVLVRSVRIICTAEVLLLEPGVTDLLVSTLQTQSDPVLVRAVTKCVARLSQTASPAQAQPLMSAAPALVSLARISERQDSADNSLGSLVNLSQVEQLRPGLGAAGTVELLVEKFRAGRSSVAGDSLVRTLCLYCREAVNRIRMREGGGCSVLVSVLSSTTTAQVMKDTVLRSLLQFLYDNHSLNVLMSEGLIPCLVKLLQQVMEEADMKHHGCKDQPSTEAVEDISSMEPSSQPSKLSTPDDQELNLSEPEEAEDEKIPAEEPSSSSDCDGQKVEADSEDIKTAVTVSVSDPSSQVSPSTPGPVFRITSPSYVAVQYELEQFMQLKSSYSQLSSPGLDPGSPSSSFCQSPDRSPPHIPCTFSPASSPYSPMDRSDSPIRLYSPLYSPSDRSDSPAPSYSPVETFSDEEDSGETQQPAPPLQDEEDKVETERQEPTKIDVSSLPSWSRRSIRIQRTTTYLGQTFVLPSRDKSPPPEEGPSKRPRLSSSSQPYKYISSLSHSPKKPLGGPAVQRQSSRCSEASPVDSEARLTWLLQILSRLSHADRPHSDLTSLTTVDVLFLFISRLAPGQVAASKASKILTRLSTNLHCLFPFLLSRHISRLMLWLESLEKSCDCKHSELRRGEII